MNNTKKFFAVLSSFSLMLSLGACSESDKLPTTQYEKVKFAFKGVERSFKNVKTSSKSGLLPMKKYADNEDGLSSLFNLFAEQDKKGDNLDDLEYDQPPMIQFQYIKKVMEKIGDNYEFDKKYYDTMTGEINIDMATGYRSDDSNNKYNYTFVLGMSINIDEQDLITADVSFDIEVAKGNETYHSKWYVGIELDYDMENTSPNYTMGMVTENDERELPYYNHYTYEYDYVDVKNSGINEWRKFCFESPNRLTREYLEEEPRDYENIADIGCFAWFKNGSYYKNNHLTDEKKASFNNIIINSLGINATSINAERFFNKEGTENAAIKTCYQEFSRIAKEDIIYSVMTREENHGGGPASIRAMNEDLTGGAGNYSVPKNVNVRELLSGFTDSHGDRVVVHVYYLDNQGGLLSEADLGYLQYKFKRAGEDITVDVSAGSTLEQCYIKYLEAYPTDELFRDCVIVFIDRDRNVQGEMAFIYDGDIPSAPNKEVASIKWSNSYSDGRADEYTIYFKDGQTSIVLVDNSGDEPAIKVFPTESGYTPSVQISGKGYFIVDGVETEFSVHTFGA